MKQEVTKRLLVKRSTSAKLNSPFKIFINFPCIIPLLILYLKPKPELRTILPLLHTEFSITKM